MFTWKCTIFIYDSALYKYHTTSLNMFTGFVNYLFNRLCTLDFSSHFILEQIDNWLINVAGRIHSPDEIEMIVARKVVVLLKIETVLWSFPHTYSVLSLESTSFWTMNSWMNVRYLEVIGVEGSEKVTLDVIGIRKPIVIGPTKILVIHESIIPSNLYANQ